MNSENPYRSPEVDAEETPVAVRLSPVWLYVSFRGRIPRWIFWAAHIPIAIVYFSVVFLLLLIYGIESETARTGIMVSRIPLGWASLAVQVKRWHDREKSAWWALLWLIPCIGPIWTMVELGCLRGWPGINLYGPEGVTRDDRQGK